MTPEQAAADAGNVPVGTDKRSAAAAFADASAATASVPVDFMPDSTESRGFVRGATVVLDIGKTNSKLTLLDAAGATLATQRLANAVLHDGPYPHHDTEHIWNWLLATLKHFATLAEVAAIVPVTHGATAALVGEDGLVLPVLDYESTLPQSLDSVYRDLRPSFDESFSPDLPAGLNLGRQLHWLARGFPAQFASVRHILMYPQYWAWRLCGVAASEVTSLGCHTDLWQPVQGQYSSLVRRMEWEPLFPALQSAWTPLGQLRPELQLATGLPPSCQVICGIHDSNASLLRYLDDQVDAVARTVLSTGTWVIAAAIGRPLDGLREQGDMLANVNALGQPVACMRFMGGREFAELAGAAPAVCSQADLQRLIAQGTLALPSFAESGGPFIGRAGALLGPPTSSPQERYALATLYSVLMTDYCLTALGAAGPIVVEGSFTDNPWFGPLLAALRPSQSVSLTNDASGTTCGGWMLHCWDQARSKTQADTWSETQGVPRGETQGGTWSEAQCETGSEIQGETWSEIQGETRASQASHPVKSLALDGWAGYRNRWLALLAETTMA